MRLLPHLMFEAPLGEVIDHWREAFPDLSARIVQPGEDGRGAMAEIEVAGQALSLFDSPVSHGFSFTPAASLMVRCDTAGEVDRIADVLGEGGEILMPLGAYDFSPRFVWLNDRFGVSWQIMQVPA